MTQPTAPLPVARVDLAKRFSTKMHDADYRVLVTYSPDNNNSGLEIAMEDAAIVGRSQPADNLQSVIDGLHR